MVESSKSSIRRVRCEHLTGVRLRAQGIGPLCHKTQMETYREGCVIELFFFQQQPRTVIACSLSTSSSLSEVVRFAAIIPKPKSMFADHI